MGRLKKHPRRYVVSIRVSDEERSALEAMTKGRKMSISSLMREALERYVPMMGHEAIQR